MGLEISRVARINGMTLVMNYSYLVEIDALGHPVKLTVMHFHSKYKDFIKNAV